MPVCVDSPAPDCLFKRRPQIKLKLQLNSNVNPEHLIHAQQVHSCSALSDGDCEGPNLNQGFSITPQAMLMEISNGVQEDLRLNGGNPLLRVLLPPQIRPDLAH